MKNLTDRYDEIKEKMAERGCNSLNFTKMFFKNYLRDRAEFLLADGCYETTKASKFFNEGGVAEYTNFTNAYREGDDEVKISLKYREGDIQRMLNSCSLFADEIFKEYEAEIFDNIRLKILTQLGEERLLGIPSDGKFCFEMWVNDSLKHSVELNKSEALNELRSGDRLLKLNRSIVKRDFSSIKNEKKYEHIM